MNKILFITVGGSHQPISTSINSQKPDRIIFICSDGVKGSKSQVIGEGKPCEVRKGTEVVEKLPNIPTQLGLGDSFQAERDLVLIQEPDNLSECYSKIILKIGDIEKEEPNCQIVADYTGGTKTMSIALAIAAVDSEVLLFVTTSTSRQNLIKVESGERTKRAPTTELTVTRTIEKTLPIYLESYNYSAAIAELKDLLQSREFELDSSKRVEELLDQCEGFEAWDRFDHITALSRLEPYMKQSNILPYGMFLKKVIASRSQLDIDFDNSGGINGNGYEVVEDLLLNAQRCAVQHRYDDAVGRLYRAIELLAQLRLKNRYNILTGDVDLINLPESLRNEYEAIREASYKNKIQLGLLQSYELLTKLPIDPLGKVFAESKQQIINALEVRNYSLFAHGFKPVNHNDYQSFSKTIGGFIRDGIKSLLPDKSKLSDLQFLQRL